MNIEENEALLTAYALGELSGKELDRIEAELEKSPKARKEVAEIRHAAELLSGEFGKHEGLAFSECQREKVLAAGAASKAADQTGKVVRADAFSRFSRWMGVSAAAACVMFAGVMGIKQFSQMEAENLASTDRQANQQQGLPTGPDSVPAPTSAAASEEAELSEDSEFRRAKLLANEGAKGAADPAASTARGAASAPKKEQQAPMDAAPFGDAPTAGKAAEPSSPPAESLRRSGVFDQEVVAPEAAAALDDSKFARRKMAKMSENKMASTVSETATPPSIRPVVPPIPSAPVADMGSGAVREELMSGLKKRGNDGLESNASGAAASDASLRRPAPGNSAPTRQRRRSLEIPGTPPGASVTPSKDVSRGAELKPSADAYAGATESSELKKKSKQATEFDAAAQTFGRDSKRGLKRAGGEQYESLSDQPFIEAFDQPLSTFAIDVDTGSYTNLRRYLTRNKQLPPIDAVRVEEMINYFDYDYSEPEGERPYALGVEVASCPWQPGHRLVKVGLKAKEMHRGERPPSNLVFLVDVSGSMRSEDKLPLFKKSLAALARKVTEDDYITIVTYAGGVGVALEPTDGGQTAKIVDAIDALKSGGSTNGEGGIRKAYELAAKHFLPGGTNRVLMATDGDFNVGISNNDELVKLVQGQANQKDKPIFLTVLGFGTGNLKDARMEQIANKGNGVYFYIDGEREGQRVLVEKLSSSLVTVAKDVKLQVDFNPGKVKRYRLIGYANRRMKAEEFRDDKKDAGEMGAGHTVTALYEIEPVGADDAEREADVPKTKSRYVKEDVGAEVKQQALVESDELLTVFTRYKTPEGEKASEFSMSVSDDGSKWQDASKDFRFAASVAGFGMLLRESEFGGDLNYELLEEIAGEGIGEDPSGLRKEFVDLVGKAKALGGR